MEDGLSFVMRPVLAKLIKYESLIDGTLGLEDILILHEAMDVDNENRYRAEQAVKRGS